jgi:hypothetical protein
MTDQFDARYFETTVIPRTLAGRLGDPEELAAALSGKRRQQLRHRYYAAR